MKTLYLYFSNISIVWHEFVNLWPLHQWVNSLLGLGFLYILIVQFLRWVQSVFFKGTFFKPFTLKICICLYISDIFLNLLIDFLVLFFKYPESLLMLVQKCPISLSPIIFIVGLIGVRFYTKNRGI